MARKLNVCPVCSQEVQRTCRECGGPVKPGFVYCENRDAKGKSLCGLRYRQRLFRALHPAPPRKPARGAR